MHDSTTCPICQGGSASEPMTDEQFSGFLRSCYEELKVKQTQFQTVLPENADWHYDLSSGQLRIGETTFPITPVGTHNDEHQTWLWAWANDSFPESARKSAEEIKSLFDLTGFQVFADPGIDAAAEDAQAFTAMAVHILDASAFFRCPDEATLYLAIKNPTPDA